MAEGKTLEDRTKAVSEETEREASLTRLKNRVRLLFEMAYKGRLPIKRLYEKGLKLEEKAIQIRPDFWDTGDYAELKDAFEFIDELHDSSTKEYLSSHKEQIYYHMRQLSS